MEKGRKLGITGMILSGIVGSLFPLHAQNISLEEVAKKLNVSSTSLVRNLYNGYFSSMFGETDLKLACRIALGTADVKTYDKNSYTADGYFSSAQYPELLRTACEAADKDEKDRVITNKEAKELLIKMINKYGNKGDKK